MRAALLAILLATPTTAFSLSCSPYDAIDAYHDAAKSDDAYVVAHGKLSFDESKLPKVDWERQEDTKPDNFLSGRFQAKSLTRKGFSSPFEREIDINIQCMGPWCGGLANGVEYLVFLKRDGDRYVLETNACGGFAFAEPTQATLSEITACMQGKRCERGLHNH